MKRTFTTLLVFISIYSWSQVLVINELDCDNPSIDTQEFVETQRRQGGVRKLLDCWACQLEKWPSLVGKFLEF